MRGLLTELSRLRSRRAAVALVAGMVALAFLVLATVVYESRPLDADETARAQAAFERESADAERQIARCQDDPENFFGPDAAVSDCDGLMPQQEWYLPRPTLDLAQQADQTGPGLAVVLAALAILVGATFAGADWSSGSMVNQLLFRPRRLRLWASKALAVTVGTTLAAALVLTGFWAALVGVARARDLSVPRPVLEEVLAGSGRGLALVAAAALGGFALTMWTRRTGGTLGTLLGLLVVVELLVVTLPIEKVSQWSLLNNLQAFAGDGAEIYDESLCGSGGGDAQGLCDPTYVLSAAHGAAVLGGLLLVTVLVSLLTFRRRDVG